MTYATGGNVPMTGRQIQVNCSRGTHGGVIVSADSVVIDDEDRVYRFTCPACEWINEKPMDDGIRGVLRSAGVATLEELVESFAIVLADDSNVARALMA